jgi:hypothetical protein
LQEKYIILSSDIFLEEELDKLSQMCYERLEYHIEDLGIFYVVSKDNIIDLRTNEEDNQSIVQHLSIKGEYAFNTIKHMESLPDTIIRVVASNFKFTFNELAILEILKKQNLFDIRVDDHSNEVLKICSDRTMDHLTPNNKSTDISVPYVDNSICMDLEIKFESFSILFIDPMLKKDIFDIHILPLSCRVRKDLLRIKTDITFERIDVYGRDYDDETVHIIKLEVDVSSKIPLKFQSLSFESSQTYMNHPNFFEYFENVFNLDVNEFALLLTLNPLKKILEYGMNLQKKLNSLIYSSSPVKVERKSDVDSNLAIFKSKLKTKVNLYIKLIAIVLLGGENTRNLLHLGEISLLFVFNPVDFLSEGSLDTIKMWEIKDNVKSEQIITQMEERFVSYKLHYYEEDTSDKFQLHINGFISSIRVFVKMITINRLLNFVSQLSPIFSFPSESDLLEEGPKPKLMLQSILIFADLHMGTACFMTYNQDKRSQGLGLKLNSLKLRSRNEPRVHLAIDDIGLFSGNVDLIDESDDLYLVNHWNVTYTFEKPLDAAECLFQVIYTS